MNRVFFALVVLAITANPACAQEKAAPAGTMRVAVVNVGVVFTKYQKAARFKAEVEELMAPFKAKAAALAEEAKEMYAKAQKSGTSPVEKVKLESAVDMRKRQLEDMQSEVSKLIGKRQEENLMVLWKEVNGGIAKYAAQKNIDLVIGYGDPSEKHVLDAFANINRKMQAMDQGGSIPLFVRRGVDISEGVADLLNKTLEQKTPKTTSPDLE